MSDNDHINDKFIYEQGDLSSLEDALRAARMRPESLTSVKDREATIARLERAIKRRDNAREASARVAHLADKYLDMPHVVMVDTVLLESGKTLINVWMTDPSKFQCLDDHDDIEVVVRRSSPIEKR